MKIQNPIMYVFAGAILFIAFIILVNYYKVTTTQISSLQNELTLVQNQIQAIENKQQLQIKDISRFQAKKYGIEELQNGPLITP